MASSYKKNSTELDNTTLISEKDPVSQTSYIEQLLEASVDAAVILNKDRQILFYNRAYEAAAKLKGRRLQQAVEEGAHCYEILPLEICQNACVGCRARDLNRSLRVDEVSAVRSDGEELTFIVAATPVTDNILIETYRDVTADVRVQRRLRTLLAVERQEKVSLEERVEARTLELRQAQAQLVLQEKMSSIGRLVAGIAHELNNPINFVYGNVDFLAQYVTDLLGLVESLESLDLPQGVRAELNRAKERIEFDYLSKDCHKLIDSIRSGAERAANIVRDLKNFSRTGSGDMREADVIAGIETTLNLIAPLHRGRIDIERVYQSDLPKLVCNAGHVNQVFMNILTNAAQAIKGAGNITIRVETCELHANPAICVAITDSGPGISPDVMEKMLDPFYTTKDVGEGTGLGLWITDNIVRSHGGKLVCDSQVGHGATFKIILPLNRTEKGRESA